MPYWTYDPQNHTYISSSGRVLTEFALNEVRDAYIDSALELVDDYATALDEGRWTTAFFESEMRRRLKNAYVAEYTLGKGGVERMTQSDYGRLGNLLKSQYKYLRGYLDDLASGKETKGTAANRARNFIGSARQAFSRGRARGRDLDLPYHPGDGGTECHGNCVTPDMELRAGGVERVFRHTYQGDIIKIKLANGGIVTVTPNHPVLTMRGWIAAQFLNNSDYALNPLVREWEGGTAPYIEDVQATAQEVFRAESEKGQRRRMVATSMNFHGDLAAEDVDVVTTERGLLAALREGREYDALFLAPDYGFRAIISPGAIVGFLLPASLPTPSVVGGMGQCLPLVRAESPHADDIRFAPASRGYSSIGKSATYRTPTYTEGLGEAEFALAVPVAANGILSIERLSSYDGHVFNLQTERGWYTANGIVLHNCRCHWDIEEDDTEVRAYWKISAAKPCAGCLSRGAESSPYVFTKPSD